MLKNLSGPGVCNNNIMTKSHIHFIKTGGTIEFFDPAYDAINKKLMRLDSTIDSYLKHLIQPHFSFSSESVIEKDSREITDQDRDKLIAVIESLPHNDIVITHGTFTMAETAAYLDKHFAGKADEQDRKIILTGSMIPITGFGMSDAGFNLGFAIASFASIKPGVYICMNGGIFHSSEAQKNESLMRFE